MSPPAHRDTEPPPSERSGRRDSVSESDMRELLEKQSDKLTRFLDGRARVEGVRAAREAERRRIESELRENMAKLSLQISDLQTKDAHDVLNLSVVREDVDRIDSILNAMVKAQAEDRAARAGVLQTLKAMGVAAMFVIPLLGSIFYWIITHGLGKTP